MNKFPAIISFRITARCDNDCKYCFGPKNIKEMSFSKLKKMFKLLYEKGAKAILLTGGEPLIRKDFEKIIKELKALGFDIF